MDFLGGFIKFGNPRWHHFSRAFKSSEAPKTNLSENYHASYVKGSTINLTLLDAAYRDTASAVKLERQWKCLVLAISVRVLAQPQLEKQTVATKDKRARWKLLIFCLSQCVNHSLIIYYGCHVVEHLAILVIVT